jgi:catechol 2,3-dioxygenase-like lactoylglutathione lyase family enzyme
LDKTSERLPRRSIAKAGWTFVSEKRARASAFAKGFGGQRSMSAKFKIISADHTGITVSNLERSLAFWRDVLGFEFSHTAHQKGEFAEEITGVEGAELKLAVLKTPGGHKIELLEYLAPADRKRTNLRPCDVGFVHVALLVKDLDAVLDRIAVSGWKTAGQPQILTKGPNAGKRVVYVRDPDGTTIELMQSSKR